MLCLQIAKPEKFAGSKVFAGNFVNLCYSMLGLQNIKKIVVKNSFCPFHPKTPLECLREMNSFN